MLSAPPVKLGSIDVKRGKNRGSPSLPQRSTTTSTQYLKLIIPPGTLLMVGKASTGSLTDVLTSAIRVLGLTIIVAVDCERSFRKTLLGEPFEKCNPPKPDLDRGNMSSYSAFLVFPLEASGIAGCKSIRPCLYRVAITIPLTFGLLWTTVTLIGMVSPGSAPCLSSSVVAVMVCDDADVVLLR